MARVSLVDEFPVKKTSNKYADQLESKIMQLERKLDNQLVESGKLLERVKDHLKNKQDSASKQLENNMAFVEVSQDCDHEPTYQVIESFTQDDPTITVVKQPDQSVIPLERAKVKFRGYYNIARHYKAGGGGAAGAAAPDGLLPRPRLDAAPRHVGLAARALARRVSDQSLPNPASLDAAPRHVGLAARALARRVSDQSLPTRPRLDAAPRHVGLAARALARRVSDQSLPNPARLDAAPRHVGLAARALARRVSDQSLPNRLGWMLRRDTWASLRARPAAVQVGVSKGLFFDLHLRYMQLNMEYVEFTKLNLTYLLKSGIPRTAYRGIVQCYVRGRRVYLAPDFLWTRYDPAWG
ncbi:hypothetical protein MSG28_015021 [Choristoneura fumiferana]|uniref:Uncharacterized protein n=1 Tax=Choristoneura fumiferana TaxID=7141 RepID=A0ACC0KYN9_CHOFU|nr:hypothetical protein MSG28_015021 [Choristoneura fumiferana]